jgi:XapX domain-containing protein
MKSVIGLVIGFLLGFACRYFDIPVPSPPKILGAVLVVTTTLGYLAADRLLAKPTSKPTIVQTLKSTEHETVHQ